MERKTTGIFFLFSFVLPSSKAIFLLYNYKHACWNSTAASVRFNRVVLAFREVLLNTIWSSVRARPFIMPRHRRDSDASCLARLYSSSSSSIHASCYMLACCPRREEKAASSDSSATETPIWFGLSAFYWPRLVRASFSCWCTNVLRRATSRFVLILLQLSSRYGCLYKLEWVRPSRCLSAAGVPRGPAAP